MDPQQTGIAVGPAAEQQPAANQIADDPGDKGGAPSPARTGGTNPARVRRLIFTLFVGGIMAVAAAAVPAAAQTQCDWVSYPDFCIPPYPPDLECWQIGAGWFTVNAPDPHFLDGDFDGIGCEG